MYFIRFPGGLRKALTLSYDDGVEQDRQLISILRRHGLKATFNLNSGCIPPEGTTYAPGTIHRRMPLSWCQETYAGEDIEVAAHCLTHASLTELTPPQIAHEVLKDRENLERDFGGIIRGLAYPFGTYSDEVVQTLRATGAAYARTVVSTRGFSIPTDWLRLHPTCHHDDPQLMALCERFLNAKVSFGSQLFYLWGHAYEFEANENWQVIEDFAAKMGGHEDIWYATNIEIVDYLNAAHQLRTSADGMTLHNPTTTAVWLSTEKAEVCVNAGETVSI